jgi:hypothetical protein
MSVVRLPISAPLGEREPGDAKDPLLKNMYKETQRLSDMSVKGDKEAKGESVVWAVKRPGLASYDDLSVAATDTGRGLFSWDEQVISVIGSEVFFDETDIGAITTSSGRVHMDLAIDAEDGEWSVVFHDGTTLYAADDEQNLISFNNGGTGGATDIENMPTAIQPGLVVLDQYVLFMDVEGFIYNSTVGDLTAGYGDTVNLETRLDRGERIIRYRNYVVGIGEKTTEIIYDAANASGSPFTRFEGMSQNIGAPVGSGNCAASADDTILYVAKSPESGRFVGKIEGGFETQRVSPPYLDRILEKEGANIANAYAYCMRVAGHQWYILTLPTTAQRTFVYDLEEDMWSEWTSDVSDTESYFTGMDCTQVDGTVVLLDEDNGLLYDMDAETYQDNGETIKAEVRTRRFDGGTMQNKFGHRLQPICDLNASSGTINVAWSDDDYQTWSTNRTIDLDSHQTWLTRLGMFKRRAFRIQHEQNLPFRISFLELNVVQGHYARGN